MNSYSASSVQFLSSITSGLPIIAGSAALVAILMFTIRYYLSPDPEPQKRVTWTKKFAEVCGAFLIIAVFLGTGFATNVFNDFTGGKNGTNKDISSNASSSMDVSGTQYDLQIKQKMLEPQTAEEAVEKANQQGEYGGMMKIPGTEGASSINGDGAMTKQEYDNKRGEIYNDLMFSDDESYAQWFSDLSLEEQWAEVDKWFWQWVADEKTRRAKQAEIVKQNGWDITDPDTSRKILENPEYAKLF